METFINPERSRWPELCSRSQSDDVRVTAIVKDIVARVACDGDNALRQIAIGLDGFAPERLEVSEAEFVEAEAKVTPAVKDAIAKAAANIEAFHRAQLPVTVEVDTAPGVRCIQKPVPIQRVGLYIPGGTAPLFSTVLMLAIPAKVVGCPEVVLCTPVSRQTGKVSAEVLYAARHCGVQKVYKVGGAQAIAALAYGTETIPKVDKIFGPGNRYVTTAKQLLGGKVVAVDMPAGPSEVMVLADESSNPRYVAADLLSQAEHGSDSQVMLVCTSTGIAEAVLEQVRIQSEILDRAHFVEGALSKSRAVVFGSLVDMMDFANAYAAEHLIISTAEPWTLASGVINAGSVFVGAYSPESAGDYASGTNHTLPTCGWARAFSGVNIDSYMRKITFQSLTPEGLKGLSETIINMAEAEGLEAHANAVKVRINET